MAKFTSGGIQFQDNERTIFGDEVSANVGITINTTISGANNTEISTQELGEE